MSKKMIGPDEKISLARALDICNHFNHRKPWKRLFAMNRRSHPAGGEFVPYWRADDGIAYRLEDVVGLISRSVPNATLEVAQEILARQVDFAESEFGKLLQSFGDSSDDFEGCFLDEEDFHDALGAIFEVEEGIKRLMDHLIALTKLCEGMAAVRAKPDEPTAEYLSSFGWTAINDADKLLFKLQNVAAILDRNCDQCEDEMVELVECSTKEVA